MMNGRGTADAAEERSPWTQPGFIAAAAVVLTIVLLGLVLAFTGGSDGQAQNPVAPPPQAAPNAPTADADASVCGLPAGSQSVPVDRTCHEVGARRTHRDADRADHPRAGEGRRTDCRSCFAHSPTGALYAAVNVIAMTADPDQRGAFIRQLTVPGVGRQRALAELARSSDAENEATVLQVSGFRIADYRNRAVVVDLAFRVDNGSQAGNVHLPLALRWLDGDWKLALPDTGQPFDGMARLSTTSGYVPWKGA